MALLPYNKKKISPPQLLYIVIVKRQSKTQNHSILYLDSLKPEL